MAQDYEDAQLRQEVKAWREIADKRGQLIPHLERERAALIAELDQWKMWAREGEELFDQMRPSALFAAGQWWADRPWRKR